MSVQPIILQLSKLSDDEYQAQIIDSPHRASSPERFKLTDAEQVIKMGDDQGLTLKELKDAIDGCTVSFPQMELLGKFLYDKVFLRGGAVEGKLHDIMIQEKQRPYRLCVRVDVKATLLETIPWEYMRHEEGYIARKIAYLTRALEDRKPRAFDRIDEVTMLLVYANPPGYGGQTRYEQIEQASTAFVESFAGRLRRDYKIKVTELLRAEATRERLASLLSTQHFDIVHFVGHGEVVQNLGHIVLQDSRVTGMEIYEWLSDDPPRLFYFNSCSTAKANDRDVFSSVAQALIRPTHNSVPAVIAMQYEIDVHDSFVLANEFYTRLLNPESRTRGNLEEALYEARRITELKNPSWGIPVLFLQTHERVMLFGEPPPEPQPTQVELHLTSSIPPLETNFINRREEIRLVKALFQSDRRLALLTGLPGIGRGAIVRAALDSFLQGKREEICIWLNLEGLRIEDATLSTLYLSLDRILESGLRQLWYDQRRTLQDKLQALEEKMPDALILVFEHMDMLLDEERRFRDDRMEQFFHHFANSERRRFIIATSQFEPRVIPNADEKQVEWQAIAIKGLQVEDAVSLLKGEGLTTHDDEQLSQLSRALDGHPQTLKIIANAIQREDLDLGKFLQVPLTGNKDLTAFFGNAVLAAVSRREQRWLKIWSVFRNPVLREALTHVANDEPAAAEIIDSLNAKGILRLQDNYYALPLLIRNIVHYDLRGDPQLWDEAQERAARFFMESVDDPKESGSGFPVMAGSDEFINNKLEARYHLRERLDDDSQLVAQQIAEGLFQWLMNRGRLRELQVLIEQSPSEISNDFEVEFFKAQLRGVTGNYQEALDILELLDLRLEHGSFEKGSVANELGVILKERSDPRDADQMLARFEEAYDIFADIIRTNSDLEVMAQAHQSQAIAIYNRGLVYQYFKRGQTPDDFNDAHNKAREYYEAALQIYNDQDRDEPGIALALSQLGEMYGDGRFREYNPVKAEELMEEAVAVAERVGNPRIEISTAYQFGRFLRRRGDSLAARALFRRVADQAMLIDLLAEQAIAEVQIAEIDFKAEQYDQENLDRALARYEERLGYYDDAHSVRVQSDAFFLHGLLRLKQEDADGAMELFKSSREVMFSLAERSRARADSRRIVDATVFLAKDALRRAAPDEARTIVADQREHFQKLGYELGEGQSISQFLETITHRRDR